MTGMRRRAAVLTAIAVLAVSVAPEDLVRFMRGFDDQNIDATADYLSRLRGRGAVID